MKDADEEEEKLQPLEVERSKSMSIGLKSQQFKKLPLRKDLSKKDMKQPTDYTPFDES